MRKRIAYSQNFLKSKALVSGLIEKSLITKNDVVYEIGAGQGIITEKLLKAAKKVIAFEIDENLFNKLLTRFKNETKLELKKGDFQKYPLPTNPYKVFSNIPFNITSAVINRLTQTNNPPQDSFLIIQKEAAKKFIGKPYDNKSSQISILLKPWFDLQIFHEFSRNDFFPRPNVDIVMLRIKKLNKFQFDPKNKSVFEDFIVYSFNQFKPNIIEGLADVLGKNEMHELSKYLGFSNKSKPGELEFTHWLGIFSYFLKETNKNHKQLIEGSYDKLLLQQKNLRKIHRTRAEANWRKFEQT